MQRGVSDIEKSAYSQSLSMDITVRNISEGFPDDTKRLESLTFHQSEGLDLNNGICWLKRNQITPFKVKASENYSLKSLWNQFEVLEIHEGLLVQRRTDPGAEEGQYQVIAPFNYHAKFLHMPYDFQTAGHQILRFNKMLTRVRQKHYWSGLSNDAKTCIAGCEKYSRRKGPGKTKQAPMQLVRTGYPMERLAVHTLGELPENELGNPYILMIADYFMK